MSKTRWEYNSELKRYEGFRAIPDYIIETQPSGDSSVELSLIDDSGKTVAGVKSRFVLSEYENNLRQLMVLAG